jgi:transposase
MMGRQVGEAQLFYIFSVDRHVPADHLLRRVDAVLDLSFIRGSLAEHYSHTGRPSIDPELMIRMLLVGYLYGIRSETRLCEEVHLNLAYRWFCRLGLDSDVPERSTFSKNRHGRFREGDLFRQLFEEVVRRCVTAGLVDGTGAAVDGSVVEADASCERRLPGDRLPEAWSNRESQAQPVRAYLDALDAASAPARDEPKQAAPKHLSETDPQAAWSTKTGAGRFRYETNYLVDTAHAVILDVEATPARLSQEIVAAKRMLQRTRDRLGLKPRCLAADGSYGTGPFLSWLVERGVEPHVPVLERKHQTEGKLTRDAFTFDRKRNLFVCPTGRELTYRGAHYAARVHTYRSKASDCAACPGRQGCTSGRVRTIVRLFDEDARDHVRRLRDTPAYARSCRERKKVEMLFAHLKRHLKLTRLRLRGLAGASEEFLLAATAQNLRKLVKLTASPTLAPSTA